VGWTSYRPRGGSMPGAVPSASMGLRVTSYAAEEVDAPLDGDDRLRLSDVGKLARRARRKVVGAARADDQPAFAGLLADHLGGRAENKI